MPRIKKPIQEIFKIINEESREEVESPIDRVIHEGVIVGLANNTVLISKDGREIPIDDSGAPIKDNEGNRLRPTVYDYQAADIHHHHRLIDHNPNHYQYLQTKNQLQ